LDCICGVNRITLIHVIEPLYWRREADGKVQCLLCPNACLISEGRHGTCRVRLNQGGSLAIPFYGKISSIAVDPIEKKPLYHFHPGAQILSVGFVGCSLRCKFCQNHTISQSTDVPTRAVSPEELVRTAKEQGSFGIAYTYSEPLIHFEYVLDCARIARAAGLANVLVTNGYVDPEPLEELLPFTDAANVDLKSFDDAFYHTELGGGLDDVKRFVARAAGRIALEVTTLVVPGKNDTEGEIEAAARFLASVSPSLPYHLSCYHPRYRYTVPPTDPALVMHLAKVARRHLRFVYAGNVGLRETNTLCPECGTVLIRRAGYTTRVEGITGGRCASCGFDPAIPGLPRA
jgi:pyruvate formate lyase activating enzyme